MNAQVLAPWLRTRLDHPSRSERSLRPRSRSTPSRQSASRSSSPRAPIPSRSRPQTPRAMSRRSRPSSSPSSRSQEDPSRACRGGRRQIRPARLGGGSACDRLLSRRGRHTVAGQNAAQPALPGPQPAPQVAPQPGDVGEIALIGGAAHGLSARTGLPFGPLSFGEQSGPQLFNTVPWTVPWTVRRSVPWTEPGSLARASPMTRKP